MKFVLVLFAALPLLASPVKVRGLDNPVEILRDRWGVPHIYAATVHDLFFAQGYITAKDRLFQIDLWRRVGTGKLSEVLGPAAIARDTLARSVNYRGDWKAEWSSYGLDTRLIVTSFVAGINAYIRGLLVRPREFQMAGYDPGLWAPEDCLSRVAGLLMTHNLTREVSRAQEISRFGLEKTQQLFPPDPNIPIEIPTGLDLTEITADIVRAYNETTGPVRLSTEQGSNNWVVDGTLTESGKPILANDPHRPVQIPSLRKTVHLVGPGWNAIGAGEPALPGIALGHNEDVAFGFTIAGIDQQDLYVEKVNPENAGEYLYRGAWKRFEVERQKIAVKGEPARDVDLRLTLHGPVIYEDPARHRAYVLKWVGSEPGTAGYLAGLSIARAHNWNQFEAAMARYKVPSENIVYADTRGNIGWQVGGMSPVRENWSGMLPVPGDSGAYEWNGFRKLAELPHEFNPPRHYIATANQNILPPGYSVPLGYEWALPFRVERIREMLAGAKKFTVQDFERMQQDVTSLPARRFQKILARWKPDAGSAGERWARETAEWDRVMSVDSRAALIYELWMSQLPVAVFGVEIGPSVDLEKLLETLEAEGRPEALAGALDRAIAVITDKLGPDPDKWQWGRLHQIAFRHPLGQPVLDLGPVPRPGDGNTVNATSGLNFQQTNGASYREILDTADWDRSVMTNVPGESGDPASPHYGDLLGDWAAGKYHPMPYSRKAVQAATEERILLSP